jgi:hypothetical protein
MDITTIEAAARSVAEARHKADEAAAAVEAAEERAADIRGRRDALRAERASLVEAARNGDTDPSAGLRVAVIDEDLKDLAPLFADAQAGIATAQAALQKAAGEVAHAEMKLAMAKDADIEARLIAHATKLDELLTASIIEIEAIRKGHGGRPKWFPSGPLADVVTRLHLTAMQALGGRR